MSNNLQTEKIGKQINQHKNIIDSLLNQINKTEDLKEKEKLYEEILEQDNTQEKYVVNYLICLKDLSLLNENHKQKYEKEVKKYHICISDLNYEAHFSDIKRINSKDKILSFFKLIRECPLQTEENRASIVSQIYYRFLETNLLEFNNTKKITWDNKELYLYFLYDFLLCGVSEMIIYYNKVENPEKILNSIEFKKLNEQLKENQQILEQYNMKMEENYFKIQDIKYKIQILTAKQTNLLLNHANYFEYISNMKRFLNEVSVNFNKRFKDLQLDKDEDKLLFEKYMHFLSTYKFKKNIYTSFWNATFVPLSLGEKKDIIKVNCSIDFKLSENGTILGISKNGNKEQINTDNYDLVNFVKKATSENSVKSLMWKKNKYILPTKYEKELFVYKTQQYWKKLLIHIFKSNAYTKARYSLFIQSQVDFFMIDDIISDIIDQIRFFIYNTKFLGNTNKKTNTIYEYGNYDVKIENRSIALLIFYGFHIIINIHEIGGYLNIRYQFFYTLNKVFSSPKIEKNSEQYYSNYAKGKEKESGETMEIKLFGRVLAGLTIKEALFILNEDNYSLDLNEFKEAFLNCNKKDFESLLSDNLKSLLEKLEINLNELIDNGEIYYYPLDRKTNETKVYSGPKSRHPYCFYYDSKKIVEEYMKKYNLIYEALKKDPNANIFS